LPIFGVYVRAGLLIAACLALRGSSRPVRNKPNVEILATYQAASAAFNKFDFVGSESLSDAGIALSRAAHDRRAESRLLCAKASSRAARLDYAGAITSYLAAKTIAEQQHDTALLGVIAIGLYAVYSNMADQEVANRYLREASALPLATFDPTNRARIAINLANGCSYENESAECNSLYRRAIDHAIDAGNLRLLAHCYSMAGHHLLRLGDLPAASRSFTERLRLTLLGGRDDLAYAYTDLARVRLAEERIDDAVVLSNRAVEAASGSPQATPVVYYVRALASARSGRPFAALVDFERAIEHGRMWRSAVISTDSARTGSSVWVQNIYSDYIAAGMQSYSHTHDQALALRLFAAAEDNRAASFREKLFSQTRMPVQYWEILARLRNTERQPQSANGAAANALRVQLNEIESKAGVFFVPPVRHPHWTAEKFSSDNSLPRYRKLLSPDEALLSFHIGRTESFLWVITSTSFEIHTLPGRDRISSKIARLRAAVQDGSAEHVQLGSELYGILFGGLTANVLHRAHWILILDDPLFQVPFAALVTGSNFSVGPHYLVEKHSVRVLPSARMMEENSSAPSTGRFVAVGDPIFNTADARWPGPRPARRRLLPFFLSAGPMDPPQLNRLAGAGTEIRISARAWDPTGSNSSVLEGMAANRRAVMDELPRSPDVLHFATHVVETNRSSDSAAISLSLDQAGEPEMLTPAELSQWRYPLGLVTLSACNSGSGKAYPGAGLFGLTRAWLLAGARAVMATQWPVTDDSGEFFRPFYTNLRSSGVVSSRAVAHALRAAQLDMLRSRSWRSQPRYWAAFFVIGKD
jgi:CHAT domain-containing protein